MHQHSKRAQEGKEQHGRNDRKSQIVGHRSDTGFPRVAMECGRKCQPSHASHALVRSVIEPSQLYSFCAPSWPDGPVSAR